MNGAEPLLRDAPHAADVDKPFSLEGVLTTLRRVLADPPLNAKD